MSEKIQYKSTMVEQKVPYITELCCDNCGKLIRQIVHDDFKDIREYLQNTPIEWYSVITGHHDWGNDSIDSINKEDICIDCIDEIFTKFKERASGNTTEYININHHMNYNHTIKNN